MERINQFAFYDLGRSLKAIADIQGPIHPNQVFGALFSARQNLTKVISGDPIPLKMSQGPGQNVLEVLEEIYKGHFVDQAGNFLFPNEKSEPISKYLFDWFRSVLTAFDTVLFEELRAFATYFVPQRGIFDTPALVDGAERSFPTDLIVEIPQKARDDWRSAGRCLAFNLLSASGFHVARAAEGMLEAYYQHFSGKVNTTLHSFFEYIKELEKIRSSGNADFPSEKVISELDQMRVDFRNPIMHPRVVLEEADARMLFSNGESVITLMAQEIARSKKAAIVDAPMANLVPVTI